MEAEHQRQVVVGAAIIRDGRLLVARRTGPGPLTGRWELPGGKVEPGESPAQACVRECRGELGVELEVVRPIGPHVVVSDRLVLQAYEARLVDAEPSASRDHDELRWLTADELADVDWLDSDRPLLPVLHARLLAGG